MITFIFKGIFYLNPVFNSSKLAVTRALSNLSLGYLVDSMRKIFLEEVASAFASDLVRLKDMLCISTGDAFQGKQIMCGLNLALHMVLFNNPALAQSTHRFLPT